MDTNTMNVILNVVNLIGICGIIYLSYRIYRYNRLSPGWLTLTLGYTVALIRNLVLFLPDFNAAATANADAFKLGSGILLVVTLLLINGGLWSMKKRFETFDIIEKRVKRAVHQKR